MPKPIADTSVLQYLYQIELIELLPRLYEQVIIPESVFNELLIGLSLGIKLPDINSLSWVTIRKASSSLVLPLVTELGAGEREVLALAVEIEDSFIILDDALARRYAQLLGLQFTGTLGVILKAKQFGYLDRVAPILDRLNSCNFRLSFSTRMTILKLAGELS